MIRGTLMLSTVSPTRSPEISSGRNLGLKHLHLLLQDPMAAKRALQREENRRAKKFKVNYVYDFDQVSTFPFAKGIGKGLKVEKSNLQIDVGPGISFTDEGSLTSTVETVTLDNIFSNKEGKYILNCVPPLHKTESHLYLQTGNGVANNSGQLECSLNFSPPLERTQEDVNLNTEEPLKIRNGKLSLGVGNSLSTMNALDVRAVPPIVINNDGLSLQTGLSLVQRPRLDVKVVPPLRTDADGIKLTLGKTLQVHDNNSLDVKPIPPLKIDATGLNLSTNESLQISSGKLEVKAVLPLVTQNGIVLKYNTNCFQLGEEGLELKLDSNSLFKITEAGLTMKPSPEVLSHASTASIKPLTEEVTSVESSPTVGTLKTETGRLTYEIKKDGIKGTLMLKAVTDGSSSDNVNICFFPRDFLQIDPKFGKYLLQLKGDVINVGVSCAPVYAEFNYTNEKIKEHILLTLYNIEKRGLFLFVESTKVLSGEFTFIKLMSDPKFVFLN